MIQNKLENLDHKKCDPLVHNSPFPIRELREAIKKPENKTAPGPDDVAYEQLKHLNEENQIILLDFFNRLWKEGYQKRFQAFYYHLTMQVQILWTKNVKNCN